MPSVTTNPRSTHLAQIVAEAVVSAYIHELAPSERRRERARGDRTESAKANARPAATTRGQRGPVTPRRRAVLELGA